MDEHFTVDGTLIEAWAVEEFPTKGWEWEAEDGRRHRLPRGKAKEPDPCIDRDPDAGCGRSLEAARRS